MYQIALFIITCIIASTVNIQSLFAYENSTSDLKRKADSPLETELSLKRVATEGMTDLQQMEIDESVDWKGAYFYMAQQLQQEREKSQALWNDLMVIREQLEQERNMRLALGHYTWNTINDMADHGLGNVIFDHLGLTKLPWCDCGPGSNMKDCSRGVFIGLSISLEDNYLHYLPECFGQHVCGTLDLSNNFLTDLPKSFGNMTHGEDHREILETLVLRKNNFRRVPDCLLNFKKLHTLDLSENPLTERYGNIDLVFQNEPHRIQCFLQYDRHSMVYLIFIMFKEILPKDVVSVICRIILQPNREFINAKSWADVMDYCNKAKELIDAGDVPSIGNNG